MKKFILLFSFIVFHANLWAQSSEVEIHLKDGQSIKTDFVRLSNGALFGGPFLATDQFGLKRIYSDQLSYVNAFSKNGKSTRFEIFNLGLLNIWIQGESISDRITLFSTMDVNQNFMEPVAYSGFSERNIIAFKKDDGKAKRISYRNLNKELGDRYESKVYLIKARNQTWLQVLSYVAGASLIGLGVRDTYRQAHGEIPVNVTRISVSYLGGISGFMVPLVIKHRKRDNMYRAMEVY